MRSIKKIVLHCTDTESSKDFSSLDVDVWHRKRGFKMIGYHFLIRLDGTIEFGRPFSMVGAHAVKPGDRSNWYNRHSVGIVYVGGKLNGKRCNTLTMAQQDSLIWLVHVLVTLFHLDADLDVMCHNQITSSKVCPCFRIDWFLSQYHQKDSVGRYSIPHYLLLNYNNIYRYIQCEISGKKYGSAKQSNISAKK